MIRKLGNFPAVVSAALFACWNVAIAQTPMPPCLAVDANPPSTCGSTPPTGGAARYLGNSMQSMTLTPFNNFGNGQWIKFVGTDPKYGNTLPVYPAALWGGTANQTDAVQQIWNVQGDITEAIASDGTVPAGVSTEVLVSKLVNAYVSPTQDMYQIQPPTSVPQGMVYTSRWLWLQGDMASRGAFGWMLLSEFKNADPGAERFGIEVINMSWTGYSGPVWQIYHDDTSVANDAYSLQTMLSPTGVATGNQGIGQTHAAAVPVGRWFRLEVAYNRNDASGNGWMWVAITDPGSSDPALQAGVQVFAAYGAFAHNDRGTTYTHGMNMTQPSKPINRIYLSGAYSDISRSAANPYAIKMTDMQVYAGWPSNATAHPSNYQ